MLNYNAYTFESKLENLFSDINEETEYTYTPQSDVWYYDAIPKTEKGFWYKVNSLPDGYKTLLSKLLNKTFSLIKNITTEQANKLLIKLLETVNNLVKHPILKKKLTHIIVFFVLATTTLTVNSVDVGDLLKGDVEDAIKKMDYKKDVTLDVEETRPEFIKNRLKPYEKFLEELAFKESSNNWKSVQYVTKNDKKIPVYAGKYQFGNIAFRDINSKVRVKDFAENPNIWTEAQQDRDLLKLFKNNNYYLRHTKWFKGYHHYIGQTINNVEITKSGVLAASHLVGNKSVKKFLKSNGDKDYADANGMKCSDYMKLFAGYELPI